MRYVFLAALILALAPGCARDQGNMATPAYQPTSEPQLIVTGAEGLGGKVSFVNPNLRYAVLTFPVGQMPALNQQLNLYRGGLKVGIVSVCGPQRDDSIVADLIMGEAQAGDEARDK
jgi:hypothetical protein